MPIKSALREAACAKQDFTPTTANATTFNAAATASANPEETPTKSAFPVIAVARQDSMPTKLASAYRMRAQPIRLANPVEISTRSV